MNCFATDTYSTMKTLWAELGAMQELQHVFFVPCDSHGLQLFMGDILTQPWFAKILETAQAIVQSFFKSNKELAILWRFMEGAYGKRHSLILNCPMR